LEALSAVALGPPTPAARRRVDSGHTETRAQESFAKPTTAVPVADGDSSQNLARLFRALPGKFAAQWLTGGPTMLGKTLVLLQQPKMALAAVVAIGLQLAAVLAMLTGDGKTNSNPSAAVDAPAAAVPLAAQGGPRDPIQTPMSVFGGGPVTPPQTLPGLDAHDLPAWPGETTLPSLAGPSVPSSQANLPAKLAPAAERLPTPAPPVRAPNAAISSGDSSPMLPQLSGLKSRSDETAEVAGGKPKARLHGTIKKISTRGATP
jgi:hypothetical protein